MQDDLQSEFGSLHAALDEMKENMLTRIKQERASRTYELQVAVARIAVIFQKYRCQLKIVALFFSFNNLELLLGFFLIGSNRK